MGSQKVGHNLATEKQQQQQNNRTKRSRHCSPTSVENQAADIWVEVAPEHTTQQLGENLEPENIHQYL